MSEKRNEKPFASFEITFRNPNSFHLFHKDEGITQKMIEDILRNITEYQEDPRKLRKRIKLYYVTTHLTERIRITISFQIFPGRLHVLNAFLGSFHHKNFYEKLGFKEELPKEVEKGID